MKNVFRSFSVMLCLSFFASAASARDFRTIAEYMVPVSQPELEPYNRYKVRVDIDKKSEKLHIKYRMPKDLFGEDPEKVELVGKKSSNGTYVLKGRFGKGTCEGDLTMDQNDGEFTCEIYYQNLTPNLDELAAYFETIDKSEEEKQGLMGVAEAFQSQPQGILFIK